MTIRLNNLYQIPRLCSPGDSIKKCYIYRNIHSDIHIYIHSNIYTQTQKYIHIYTHTYIHVSTRNTLLLHPTIGFKLINMGFKKINLKYNTKTKRIMGKQKHTSGIEGVNIPTMHIYPTIN